MKVLAVPVSNDPDCLADVQESPPKVRRAVSWVRQGRAAGGNRRPVYHRGARPGETAVGGGWKSGGRWMEGGEGTLRAGREAPATGE